MHSSVYRIYIRSIATYFIIIEFARTSNTFVHAISRSPRNPANDTNAETAYSEIYV